MLLQPQVVSVDVLREKYAKGAETSADEIYRRVAKSLASVESRPEVWEERFYDAMRNGFIPAGRIMSAAGTGIQATLINCFVQGVGDSMLDKIDGKPGIMIALGEAAETMRRGGGVGYDFSRIRPNGAFVKKTSSTASGPLEFMDLFNAMCKTVESAGARRGAQMGVLRCDHPDIEAFIDAKGTKGRFTQFNLSIGVTDDFMRAVELDSEWELVHKAEPAPSVKGTYKRDDGLWVYRKIHAKQLWDKVMRNTYDHAEPGVLFIDRANAENNLHYCETFEACNPCAEEFLPDYGCCCLGSVDLTRFVSEPFTRQASFDHDGFGFVVRDAIRMLDNVLDVTYWPLAQQKQEAMNKRRIGLGYTGLGDTLIMLGHKYDTQEARAMAVRISETLRDESYRASIELAKEKGAFPLLNTDKYLQSGFAKRLPENIKQGIRIAGIRNSHLNAIAPTGTISLAFADNASNGIEPPYSWVYTRKKRQADGSKKEYLVEDHAFRLYRSKFLPGLSDQQVSGMSAEEFRAKLPSHFVTALEIAAKDHQAMVSAVQLYIDTSISKTVNVPSDYPIEDFVSLYLDAWKSGAKGLATFRPNNITGSVLSVEPPKADQKPDLDESDPDRRLTLNEVPVATLSSLRWRKRPKLPSGNPAWCYMVGHPRGYKFAVFIGHVANGENHPFEVWVNGAEQPRGLGALAKSLSMDMRSMDRAWLKRKLETLSRINGDDVFALPMPPEGQEVMVPSLVAGFARLVEYRCAELGVFGSKGETPLLDALMSTKEPKTGPNGTLSWTADISNPATGDEFSVYMKELVMPNGQRRPYAVELSKLYPKTLEGLCESLSLDMRVVDPAWVGAKLRQLLDFSEAKGDFLAKDPMLGKSINFPSTVAYLARLMIHRYAMLGVLDEEGYPLEEMGAVSFESDKVIPFKQARVASAGAMEVMPGKRCDKCGNYSVIRKDGCDFCTACGETGACG